MALITEEIELMCNGSINSRYESLGYTIPRETDKQGRLSVKFGTTIMVKSHDLSPQSNYIISAKCDVCGAAISIQYCKYTQNTRRNNGLFVCSNRKLHNGITSKGDYDNLVNSIKSFHSDNGRFPRYDEFSVNNGLISYRNACSVAKSHGCKLQEISRSIKVFDQLPEFANGYDEYSILYIEAIKECGCAKGLYSVYESYKHMGLPDPRWMINNAPSEYGIVNIDSWFEHYGIAGPNISKELATKLIMEYSRNSGKALMYDDFRGNKFDLPSISTVRKYWGTINKMKAELGLEIIQDSMCDKDITIEKIDAEVILVANHLINIEKRTEVIMDDFIALGFPYAECTLRNYVRKYYNCSMPIYLKRLGLTLVSPGRGLVHDFEDGERTTSQYENIFSSYLRGLGLVYNVDYFRDVKYSKVVDGYTGNMNCDYVITYKKRKIFVEIAGVIAEYKSWYYSNKHIKSCKTKNKYMDKLHEKESMLSGQGLDYFILFPCDLTCEILVEMLVFEYKSTFEKIIEFNHTNVDWVDARKRGRLEYDFSNLSKGGTPAQVMSA